MAEVTKTTIEQNKKAMRSIIEEGFNQGNHAALDPLFVPGYKEHQFSLKKTWKALKMIVAICAQLSPIFV